ncbi:MAG: XrtA system polysaccharide chain length determinant [Pseudomonadota bacterium]
MNWLAELPRPVIRFASGMWRRRWIAVTVAWLCALLGWFGVWMLPDKYESRAHVFVQTETILEPVLKGIMARPDYSRRVEVMQQQLLTRPNVEEIIFRAGLDAEIEAKNELDRRRQMEGKINWISGAIDIASPQEMYFVITFKHGDPKVARDVVDAVLNLLIEQDLGASLAENEAARRRLDLRIRDYRERLAEKDLEIAAFRRNNSAELLIVENNTRLREQKDLELLRVGEEIDQTTSRIATLQNLLSSTPRTNSQTELDTLRLRLADLRSQYEESHPDIRGVVARIEQLENSGGGALSSNPQFVRLNAELRAAQASMEILKTREERLRKDLEEIAFTASQAPAAQAELQRIMRDYEQTSNTFDELVARRDTLALTESLGAAGRGVEYQVYERPQAALTPSDPPRLLLIVGVAMMALGAGLGIVFLLTVVEKSFSQAEDLRDAFGLPVLGALSEVSSKDVVAARVRDFVRLGVASASLAVLMVIYIYVVVIRAPGGTGAVDASAAAETSFTERLR